MRPDEVAKQYDEAIAAAERVVKDTEGRYNSEINRLNGIQAVTPGLVAGQEQPNPEYMAVAQRVQALEASMRTAREQYTVLLRQKADALNRAATDTSNTPEQKAKLVADAKHAEAQAEAQKAQAAYYGAQTANATAKTDIERQQAQAAMQQASNGLINAQANLIQAQSQASLVPSQIALNTARAGAETAGVSLTSAQATQAQAQAAKVQAEADALRKQLASTTDADIRRTLEAEIQKKEGEVAEIKSRITASDAGVTKGQLGPMYGYAEKVAYIDDLLRKGVITDKASAMAKLQEMLDADLAGTTPYESFSKDRAALESSQNRAITQRGQDANLVGTRTSTFGSLAGSALGDTLSAARYGTPGSDAGAGAYASVLANMLQLFGGPQGFQTPAPVSTDVPMWAQRTLPTASAPSVLPGSPAPEPQQSPTPSPASQPLLPPGQAGAVPQSDPRFLGTRSDAGGFQQSGIPEGTSRGGALSVPAFAQNMGPADQSYLDQLRQQRLAIVNGGGGMGLRAA